MKPAVFSFSSMHSTESQQKPERFVVLSIERRSNLLHRCLQSTFYQKAQAYSTEENPDFPQTIGFMEYCFFLIYFPCCAPCFFFFFFFFSLYFIFYFIKTCFLTVLRLYNSNFSNLFLSLARLAKLQHQFLLFLIQAICS